MKAWVVIGRDCGCVGACEDSWILLDVHTHEWDDAGRRVIGRPRWEGGSGNYAWAVHEHFREAGPLYAAFCDEPPDEVATATKVLVVGHLDCSQDYWGEYDEWFELDDWCVLDPSEPPLTDEQLERFARAFADMRVIGRSLAK